MFRPMLHNTVDFRPWNAVAESIVGAPIACAKCGKPGRIASAAMEGHQSGRFAHAMRLMVEAYFDCCGYQTIYFQKQIDRAIAFEPRSLMAGDVGDPRIANELSN